MKSWKTGQMVCIGEKAHRDAREYIDTMQAVGLVTDSDGVQRVIRRGTMKSNPHQILPDSSLLMVTVGQKLQ